MKTDSEYMKEAMKALPDGDLDTLLAYARATKERDALASGESPEGEGEEPAPEEEPMAEPGLAASEAPAEEQVAASEPAADAVELDEAAPAEEPLTDPVSLMADEATMAALTSAVEELSGMDAAGALAVMQERAEEFQALFQGAAPSGGEAEAGAALMSEVAAERVRALGARVAQRDVEIQKLSAEVRKLNLAGRERRIDDAIKAGDILPDAKSKFMKLAETAPDMLEVFLSDAKGSPAVPTEPLKVTPPDARTADDDGSDLSPKLRAKYVKAFARLPIPEADRRKAAITAARKFAEANPTDPDVTSHAPRA